MPTTQTNAMNHSWSAFLDGCAQGFSPELQTHFWLTLLLFIGTAVLYTLRATEDVRKQRSQDKLSAADPHDSLHAAPAVSHFRAAVLIRWLLAPLFVSLMMLFFLFAQRDPINNPVTAVVDSLLRAAQGMTPLGMSLNEMWEYAESIGLQLLTADRVWIAFMVGVAPVLSISTAATLFRVPLFWYMQRQKKRDICIFSDLNDRARMYASALQKAFPHNTPYIVFCSDGNMENEAANINGQSLVLKQGVCSLRLRRKALPRISFYLITDNENTIIEQALQLQNKYLHSGCHIHCVSAGNLNEHAIDQMNLTADKAPSAKSARSADKHGAIRFTRDEQINALSRKHARTVQTSYVGIINEAARVVYHNFYDSEKLLFNQDFLRKILPAEGDTTIRALVLGAGTLGVEISRTLLWYCQLPNTRVNVTVAGQEPDKVIRSRVYKKNQLFSELVKKTGYSDRLSLNVRGDLDLLTDDLESILAESSDGYHFVFIATGQDNQNYQLALRIRQYYLRSPMSWGYPDIRTVIWDDAMTSIVQSQANTALCGASTSYGDKRHTDYALLIDDRSEVELYNRRCSVMLMGSMSETIRTIDALAHDALRYHTYYSLDKEHQSLTYISKHGISRPIYRSYYASSESDKLSNWALALHGRIKYQWYLWYTAGYTGEALALRQAQAQQLLAKNEHVRWCIFKLLEGDAAVSDDRIDEFRKGCLRGRDADAIRGFHITLRPWEELGQRAANATTPEDREFWQKMQDQNAGLVSFALDLEAS